MTSNFRRSESNKTLKCAELTMDLPRVILKKPGEGCNLLLHMISLSNFLKNKYIIARFWGHKSQYQQHLKLMRLITYVETSIMRLVTYFDTNTA